MSDKNIVPTDEEIDKAFENTNFGPAPKMHILKFSLLKVASGYHTGYTAQCILHELKLINQSGTKPNLSKRGRYCLWEWFQSGYKDY